MCTPFLTRHSQVATRSQNQVFIIIIPLNGTRSRWNLFYGEGSVSELLMTSHLFPGSIVLNGHHLINHHQQQRWPPQTTTRTKNHHRVRQFHQVPVSNRWSFYWLSFATPVTCLIELNAIFWRANYQQRSLCLTVSRIYGGKWTKASTVWVL